MKIMMKKTVLFCALAILIACNPKIETPVAAVMDKEQIKKEIQAREDEFAAVYNGDVVKDIGYYAEDARTFFQNVAPLEGKKAIVDFLMSDLVDNTNKISFTTNEVFVCGDGIQVLEIGYFKVVNSTSITINSGNYFSLFEKRDGKYVCLRDMSASDRPLE
jgi:ketosteroid isomerase-like protein